MPPKTPQILHEEFDLEAFLPFILNQAAEVTGKAFQNTYRRAYGMSRTQWRVLAIVGRYGNMAARDICDIAHEEKSKISRAVAVLEDEGYISRESSPDDKRSEILSLTVKGKAVFKTLGCAAVDFNIKLREELGPDGEKQLLNLLTTLRRAVEGMNIQNLE